MNTNDLTPVVNAQNQIVQPKIKIIDANLILKQKKLDEKKSQQNLLTYHVPKGFATDISHYSYKAAPQDVLQIKIWNQTGDGQAQLSGLSASASSFGSRVNPDMSGSAASADGPNAAGTFIVNSQGNIFYPYLGNIHVQGKSATQIHNLITRKMSHFFENPQVTVNVMAYNSQRVAVTGAVEKPTTLPVTNVPLDVLTAVMQAGGGHRVVQINLNSLRAVDGSSNNWILKNKDIVYVPNNNASRVFVLGAVNLPSPYNMIDGKMTLRDALGDARGTTFGSSPRYTYVIRDYRNNPRIYVLNLVSPDALNLAGEFNLKPSDVVYVSTSAIHTFGQIMTDVSGPLLTAVAVKSLATWN
ncbi:MAG: polysaccharide biosynthesis/export family protein [Gammaproteobacteria bacterium]|nr:polysaccharide biosynthesis/export family protein [Gammaproteobacteria bacterium]